MLADAYASEQYRFIRNRTAVFWGFGFVPVLILVLGIAIALGFRSITQAPSAGLINFIGEGFAAMRWTNAPPVHLFLLIGAAAIFTADYRWETWRLVTPRNSRINLLLGKLAVYGVAALISLIAMFVLGVLAAYLGGLITHTQVVLVTDDFFNRFARALIGSWLEMMLVGSVACLVGVVTRSAIASLMLPLVLSCVQAFSTGFMDRTADGSASLKDVIIHPSLAAEIVRGVQPAGAYGAGVAAVIVIAWIAVVVGASLAWFQRQDLTRE